MWPSRRVRLPTTDTEFEALVTKVMRAFKLQSRQHTSAVIAAQIQHLPPTQAYSTVEYFGHSALKNLAYQLARNKANVIQHEIGVSQLEANLTANPGDTQSMDQLEKAAKEGSIPARAALDRLFTKPENVVSLN